MKMIPCREIECFPTDFAPFGANSTLHVKAITKEGYVIEGDFTQEEARKFVLMKKPFFKNWREMRNYWSDCYDSNRDSLSHGEQVVIKALQTLSDNYAWNIYMAIYTFLDPCLKHLTVKPQ